MVRTTVVIVLSFWNIVVKSGGSSPHVISTAFNIRCANTLEKMGDGHLDPSLGHYEVDTV
jgi:hypothetical protein